MPTLSFTFAVAQVALLGTPLLSPVAAWLLRRTPAAFQRRAFASMAAVLACVVAALAIGISATRHEANAVLLAMGWGSVGVLGISAFRLKRRPWNIVVGALATLLLCASVVAGTVGVLLVGFVVGDTVPIYAAALPGGRACYVTTFGSATTSEAGFDVTVTRRWALVPFLELETTHWRDTVPSTPETACAAALQGHA